MLRTLKILIGLFLGCFFGLSSFVLFQKGLWPIGLVFIIICGVSVTIWSFRGGLTYRFLYPGMLAFLLFTILPIFFSVFISFTNLGTGHFFSQEKVTNILLSEKFLDKEGAALPFKLFPDLTLQIQKEGTYYQASLNNINEESKIIELKEATPLAKGSPLSMAEVYNKRQLLKDLVFILPNKDRLLYHRVDKLIEGGFIYEKVSDDTIKNTQTGLVYRADNERGAFRSSETGEVLEPGFYTYIGLKNFKDLFGKEEFRKTFFRVSWWTFLWALISVILTFSLGLSLALFLNDKNLKFKAIYRNLLILPYSIPFFISVLVFKGMLNKDFGVVNSVLQGFGISAIPWLENGLWAKVSCLMVNLWLGFPYMFLLTTGILQSIPESVYEAAKIDGASRWQSFRSITLPLILNSITPLLIGAFAFNLGNFVGIYLLTGGGPAMADAITPAGQTDILISYTYRLAFEGAMGQQFGVASSIALFIFVIIGALTALNFKVFNKEQDLS